MQTAAPQREAGARSARLTAVGGDALTATATRLPEQVSSAIFTTKSTRL